MVKASVFVTNLESEIYQENTEPMVSHINVDSGVDCTIRELSETIAATVGHEGDIIWDETKPDGTPRKLMEISRISSLGWNATVEIYTGLKATYDSFLKGEFR